MIHTVVLEKSVLEHGESKVACVQFGVEPLNIDKPEGAQLTPNIRLETNGHSICKPACHSEVTTCALYL